MRIKTLSGHITQTEKRHIKAIKKAGMMNEEGVKANRKTYSFTFAENTAIWTVWISEQIKNDYGTLQTTKHRATFQILK